MNRALQESEEIATARAALAQAEAQVTQATAGALPQLSSSLTYNRAIKSIFDQAAGPPPVSDTLIPPAFDLNKTPKERFDLLSELLVAGLRQRPLRGLPFGRKNTYIATFTLAQPLYVGGKVGAALKVARHFRAAAEDQLAETEADIALQVRSAYLTASLAQRLLNIALDSRRVAREHFDQVQSFYEAGTAAEFDVLRARVDLENRDPVVVQAENSARLAVLELKRLVNIPAEQPRPPHVGDGPERGAGGRGGSPADGHGAARAPGAAAENVGMREQAVKIAKAQPPPYRELSGDHGVPELSRTTPSPRASTRGGRTGAQPSPSPCPSSTASAPGGRSTRPEADLKTAELQESQLRESLSLQLAGALAEYHAAQTQIRARQETVAMAQRALELADVRFASGMSTQLEVSDAALLLDQARVNEVQALYDYVRALATLERLSGGKMELLGRGN